MSMAMAAMSMATNVGSEVRGRGRPMSRSSCRRPTAPTWVSVARKPVWVSASGRNDDPNPGPALKALWYASEKFGDVVTLARKLQGKENGKEATVRATGTCSEPVQKLSFGEAEKLLRADYDASYFVSGRGSMEAYSPSCVFADPFVSFEGVDRFKKNVSSLGSLMQDINLDITSWEVDEAAGTLTTGWRFSCILDLPWRPRLAASGGTTHTFDTSTGLVVRHLEYWNIDPNAVAKQLFRPANKVPTSAAETLMMSISEGDLKGTWLSLSRTVGVLSVVPLVFITAASAAGGNGAIAEGGGGFAQAVLLLCCIASAVTEAVKVIG